MSRRTLSSRLWARGINPHLVKREGANMVRSLVNMRGHDSLAEFRDYVRRNPERKGYAIRMAKIAVNQRRHYDNLWRERGGYLP